MNKRIAKLDSLRSAFLAVITAAVVAAGCSGGTGGTGVTSGPGVSQGVITSKGSIFVNGIEYSTTGATIKIDDNPGIETDLKVGMVVKVQGTSDDVTRKGTATQVEARDILEGTIANVDSVNKTITVMGQTVRVEDNVTRLNDDDTQKVFADANFQLNDVVEVHGFADDQSGVRATRVVKKTSGEFEGKGFVTALGPTQFGLSLTPGGAALLTVTYTTGQLPAGTVNGSFVEVKSAAAPVAGVIAASLIHLEDALGTSGQEVEVEGIVTSGTVASFVVNGRQVVTNAATLFEGGLASDFAVGVELEAEGQLNASGAIVATKISFDSNIKIVGIASGVTSTTLTVLTKVVAINQLTLIDNGPLANGDYVEVRAKPDRNGNLIATRIIKQSPDTKAFLQGPVTAADSVTGTLTIVGILVVSDNGTEWRASSTAGDTPVTKATFFSKINVNVTVVKVKWDPFVSLAAPIKEAEIELGD